jgi:RNA polymerase sigma-70 factor (ECF subfamily)
MNDTEQMLARLRQRDVTALGEFMSDRRPQLLAFIERQLGAGLRGKLEPEDVLQEVGVEAVRSLPQMDLADREPFSWLCQIAERRIIDAHRKFFGAQKRAAGREVPLGTPGGDSQHAAMIDLLVASMTRVSMIFSRNQREAKLLAALEQLPAEHREALRLRYLEGLPSKEVAQRLGKSDGSVRVMLTRSLHKLQEVLGSDDE